MKVLAWNVNHRAAKRKMPGWIAIAIADVAPQVLILTEYVTGPDHQRFTDELSKTDLPHLLGSDYVEGQNQVLIAAAEPMTRGTIVGPQIHPAVPPNALHVILSGSGIHCLGFRMPAFTGIEMPKKRQTWDWLLGASQELRSYPSFIAGDFNTAEEDSASYCGDCLRQLAREWKHARPSSGHSFKSVLSMSTRCIDHIFASPSIEVSAPRYSWDFHRHGDDAKSGKVGIPDHAMLIVELQAPKA